MKSDISEFLKETKPSLIQMLATQVEAERSGVMPEKRKDLPWLKAAGFSLFFLLLVAGGYAGYQYVLKNPPEEANVIIPQPFFTVEKTAALQYTPRELENLRSAMKKEAGGERLGSLKRLVVLIEEAGTIRHITPAEFTGATGLKIPELLLPTLTAVMPVYYEGANGIRSAILFKSSDPKRFLDIFFRTESGLITGWAPLFLNTTPPTRIIGFEDRLYRNIGYRILPLDPELDLSLTYGLYPAKNYLILTSSEAAFKAIIDRLFEAS